MGLFKLSIGLILVSIISSFVFAGDDAPPALPIDVYGPLTLDGSPAPDGLDITVEVDEISYEQVAVTKDGMIVIEN